MKHMLNHDKKEAKMTFEDAIKHLEEVIPEMECSPCKDEHVQLLGWLKELKSLKEVKAE